MTATPLVTVVSPLYNGERYVPILIDCMRAQTYTNWRYVIVDNNSKDRTNELAMAGIAGDPRMSLVRNPETYGVIRNHNEAFRQVLPDSDWFRFLQADDVLMPECIERAVALGEAHPSIGLIGSWLKWGDDITSNELPEGVGCFAGKEIARRTLQGETYPFLTPSALMWRMDAVRSRSPFFDEQYLYADVMACYEVLRDHDFGMVDAIMTDVGRDEGSVTNKVTKSFNKLLGSNLHLFTRYAPEFLERDDYAERLEQHLTNYYTYLAHSSFERREPAFWDFHREMFRTCGLQVDESRIRSSAFRELRSHPRWMISKLVRSFFQERVA